MKERMSKSYRKQVSVFGITVAAFGLLLWSRLLLVSSAPRIATATPTAHHASTPQPTIDALYGNDLKEPMPIEPITTHDR